MTILYLLLAWALVVLLLIGIWYYLNVRDKRYEVAELARFKTLSPTEKLSVLVRAEAYLDDARFHFERLHKLWRSYKWGYRRNPYFIPRFAAELEYSRAFRLVQVMKEHLGSNG